MQSLASPIEPAHGAADLQRRFSVTRVKEQTIEFALLLCALVSIATTLAIIFVLVAEAVVAIPPNTAFFQEVSLWGS